MKYVFLAMMSLTLITSSALASPLDDENDAMEAYDKMVLQGDPVTVIDDGEGEGGPEGTRSVTGFYRGQHLTCEYFFANNGRSESASCVLVDGK